MRKITVKTLRKDGMALDKVKHVTVHTFTTSIYIIMMICQMKNKESILKF